MLLAADLEPALEPDAGPRRSRPARRRGRRRSRPARARRSSSASATVTDGAPRPRSPFGRAAPRGGPRRGCAAATANTAWPWNMTSRSTSSGSSAKTGAMSFLPGMSAAVSTATTPGAARTAREIEACQHARRRRRHADRDMERALGLADVVDVGRPSPARAAGRNRAAGACGRPPSASAPRGRHSAAWSAPIRVGARSPEISISALRRTLARGRHPIGRGRAHVGQRREVRGEGVERRPPALGSVEARADQRALGVRRPLRRRRHAADRRCARRTMPRPSTSMRAPSMTAEMSSSNRFEILKAR